MTAPEIHERIWLEPTETDPDNGRQWCQDNAWGDDATEYVLASSVTTLQARVAELEDELYEAQQAPWPEWVERILKALQRNGYDPVDNGEVDLAAAFEDYLAGIQEAEEHDRGRAISALKLVQYEAALREVRGRLISLAWEENTTIIGAIDAALGNGGVSNA